MLFRDCNGKLVELCKYNYLTDTEYYRAIMKVKGLVVDSSKQNEMERLMSLIGSTCLS